MASSYRVLYVDDEPSLLEITKLYLEKKAGFSVDCSLSGSEALSQIAAGHYDAVVSDYQMPEMDGITLLKKVREIHKTLPFILFTGRGREEVVIEAINSGVDFYLQKGGDPVAQYAELSHKIRTAVERRTSERALKESGNRYRSLVDNMHDCVAIYKAVADGENFLILEFNKAAEKTERVARDEIVGRTVTDIFPGVQEFGILDVFRRVWRTGIPESFPISFYKDNRISGWRDNFIFKLPSGEIVASYSDETARKQAEEAQQKSEEKYRLTLDATNDGIWDWNIPTGGTFFSYRWYTMIGYDPGELPATYATWRSLLHPDDAGRAEQKIQDHIGQKVESYSVEFRMRTKQGDWKWILARGKVVERDSGGNPIRMVGTHTDIDERKRIESELEQKNQELMASYEQLTASEEELKSQFDELSRIQKNLAKSEEQYRSLVETTGTGYVILDKDGRVITANQEYLRLCGRSTLREIQGRTVTDWTAPYDLERNAREVEQCLKAGQVRGLEIDYQKPDGTIQPVEINASVIQADSGQIILTLCRDITERRMAAEVLRESEERFRTTIEQSPLSIQVLSPDGRTVQVNRAFEELWGLTLENLKDYNMRWDEQLTALGIMPYINRGFSGEACTIPPVLYDPGKTVGAGGKRWVLGHIYPVRNAAGAIRNVVVVHEDITERKEAEELLHKSEERYRVVADFTFDWEYWIVPDGKFIYVSPSCERITGYRPEEFIHDPGLLVTITHPDDRGRVITHLSNVKSGVGEHNALEFRIITKNGEARWIGHECQPVYNTNSEYLGNRASNRDITERKEAEQKIAESSRFLATLIDTLPVPVFYKSADGKYLGCNPPFEEYIGILRSELIGKTVYDISPKDLADKYRAADQEMIENPARQQYETQIMFADGSRHDVIFYKAPFYTSDGSVGGLIGTFIDITERKRIESDLERKNQELRGSYEQLTASEEELRHTVDELSRSEQELRKSEEQVRVKLESLLSPGGDIGTLELGDIINAQEFQSMMDDFYAITHMGIGIIDIQGNVLVGTGWQEICTGFHRVNPETCANCVESDTHLTEEVEPGTFRKYRCKNNMWDIVTPIIVGGNHVGNIFLGQFLYDDESIDIELFRAQAARYGFDEQAYLAALERVPRWSREKVDTLMTFYAKFAQMISSISYRNLQLARTVTERDSLLHSLQESERKYRTLGENIPEKIFVKDTALAYVSCNEHYARDLGIAAEGIAGKTDFDFFPRDLADHYHEVDRTVIASGTTRTIEERYIKDGRESWISMSKTPIRDDTGNITGILGIFHDITERKMAQDALDRATKKLNLLNSITFADIQNAVFSLSGYLDLEKTIPMNEKLQQYLKKEIGIVETIKESLTFSANYQSLGLKPPEWQDVLQSFLFGISHLDISNLSRRLDVEELEIFADPLLENVFFTLAENVVMHGKTATEIVFRYHESPDGLTLIFEDNGAGIQNDMKEKIFDRRFEEKKGMGLFLAREILSITDMTIKETGEPGKGARFEIFVPNGVYRFTGSKGKNR
ncbi:MAG: PAS domain S-box protein [Methanoregula sp.]